MRYQLLFQVQGEHGYYPDNRCAGLRWLPDGPTQQNLARYRLQWRELPDGGAVWIPMGSGSEPLVPLAPGEPFRFELEPRESAFYQFTAGPPPGKKLVFSNSQNTGASTGLAMREEDSQGAWGEVEIINNASLTLGKRYAFSLSPSSATWRLYIVYDGQTYPDPGKFSVEDGSQESPALSFPNNLRRSLTRQPDPNDPVGIRLMGLVGGRHLLRMASNAPVTLRQKVRKNIRLKYGNGVLVNHLPNPAPAEQGVRIVHLP
jgi:hypothetical protein